MRRRTENTALTERLRVQLDKKMEMDLTDETVEGLRKKHNKLDSDLAQLYEESGSIERQLSDNIIQRKRYMEKEKEHNAAAKKSARWEKLNQLIGSANGNRYRAFAQGLTFEHLIYFANSQLEKMSDRYLLKRSEDDGLELNVIDNYQGGDERTTKNLSGGESFIVSMALALGLSRMASSTVKVDSLFLDEGFDTLDDDTLEVALNTLSTLHQEGKIIGVISHLESLKSRIPTRIQVEKKSGGRSILKGPGITSVK